MQCDCNAAAAATHAHLAAVGWTLRGYSEQYSGFQTVIVLYHIWASHTEGNDGLETRVPRLRPREISVETYEERELVGPPASFFQQQLHVPLAALNKVKPVPAPRGS